MIAPSDLKIVGRSSPAEMYFDNTIEIEDVETDQDLGPDFEHVYTVTNLGPHTVGRVKINITWPLRVRIDYTGVS